MKKFNNNRKKIKEEKISVHFFRQKKNNFLCLHEHVECFHENILFSIVYKYVDNIVL